MDRPPDASSCHSKALELLARRAHFRAELEAKLRSRGYGEQEVAQTLERLEAAALIDDSRNARAFIAERRRRAGVGRNRLRAELERRGVAASLVDECLPHSSDDEELTEARRAAERWLARGGRSRHGREALARHLDRKGFSSRAILAVLGEREDPAEQA